MKINLCPLFDLAKLIKPKKRKNKKIEIIPDVRCITFRKKTNDPTDITNIRNIAQKMVNKYNLYLDDFSIDVVAYNVYQYIQKKGMPKDLHGYVKQCVRNAYFDNYRKYIKHEIPLDEFFDYYMEGEKENENNTFKNEIYNTVIELLSIYYTKEEINYYLPLCVKLLDKNIHISNKKIKLFLTRLKGVCYKIRDKYQLKENLANMKIKTAKQMINASLTSSLLLSLFNTIDEEHGISTNLLLALDYKSLYRLMELAGGTTVNIPTLSQFNSLLTSVQRYVKNKIFTEEHKDKALDSYLARSVNYSQGMLLDKLCKIYNIENENEIASTSVANILENNIKVLNEIFEKVKDKDLQDVTVVKLIKEVNMTITELCGTLVQSKENEKN